MISYSYLNDSSFLKEFDKQKIKEQYIKITALDFRSEMELEDVEGKVISGNLNLSDGAVRRNGNLTMIADDITIDLKNLNSIRRITLYEMFKSELDLLNKRDKNGKLPQIKIVQASEIISEDNWKSTSKKEYRNIKVYFENEKGE